MRGLMLFGYLHKQSDINLNLFDKQLGKMCFGKTEQAVNTLQKRGKITK